MAQQNDSLTSLISIQQELLRNTDLINEQVKAAGRLGAQFYEARKITEGLNAALRGASDVQADLNKTFFTTLQVRRATENLEKEQNKILAARKVVYDSLTAKERSRIADYKIQQRMVQRTNEEMLKQEDILRTIGLSNQEYQAATAKIGYATALQNRAQAKLLTLSKDRKVAEIALYDVSRNTIEQAVQANKEYQKRNSIFDNFGEKVKDLGQRLSKSDFTKGLLGGLGISGGMAGIFKSLVQTAFQLDTSLTNVSRASGTSAEFSKAMAGNYMDSARNIHSLNTSLNTSLLTVTGMLKAQQELQASSGQMALFTEKSVQDQLYLTKQLGLQADEAANLQKLSMLTGDATSKTTDDIYEQVAAANKFNNLRTSGKDVLVAVSKIEGMLAVNYRNNPKFIAAAVTQAKALGVTLEQAAAASNSLLDFESSIANELEAELLTGKKWNLEKARSLALDGDSAGAMREMLKNVGGYANFMKQNVIARQSEAKAIGMTADELANSLRSTELMSKVSKETKTAIEQSGEASKYNAQLNAATNAKEMQAAEKRVSAQMQFESSMEKVREAVGMMASGPMLELVNMMQLLTEHSMAFKGVLVVTAAIMAAIAASSIATAIGMTIASGGMNIAMGTAALAAAGLAAYAVNATPSKSIKDGLISPSGQIMISTPEGMIKPSKNDSIITTTNPGALLGGGGSGKSEQLLSAILSAVQKPGKVYMGATEVGTTLGMSYSAYA